MKLCIKCSSQMEIRRSGNTYFWRCDEFPRCKHYEIIHDVKEAIDFLKKSSVNRMQNRKSHEQEEALQLGEEQLYAFNLLENSNKNIFITGKAGTGKSVLLRYFVRNTSKRVIVLAPTGVAAMNVGGQTLHSFFCFRP